MIEFKLGDRPGAKAFVGTRCDHGRAAGECWTWSRARRGGAGSVPSRWWISWSRWARRRTSICKPARTRSVCRTESPVTHDEAGHRMQFEIDPARIYLFDPASTLPSPEQGCASGWLIVLSAMLKLVTLMTRGIILGCARAAGPCSSCCWRPCSCSSPGPLSWPADLDEPFPFLCYWARCAWLTLAGACCSLLGLARGPRRRPARSAGSWSAG